MSKTNDLLRVVWFQVFLSNTNNLQAIMEKTWRELHKNATSYSEQIPEATSHKTAVVWLPTSLL